MLKLQNKILWAREWENSIAADVKFSKQCFNYYFHLLHKISIVNSKFRNSTINILCSVLNSRLLKPSILKLSFMCIEIQYNLCIRVYITLNKSKSANYIIFLDYSTGRKIVVPENFDFQYSKNFLCIKFFGPRAKNWHRSSQKYYLKIDLPHFRISIWY